jgi:hypothetical protein
MKQSMAKLTKLEVQHEYLGSMQDLHSLSEALTVTPAPSEPASLYPSSQQTTKEEQPAGVIHDPVKEISL